MHREMKYAKTRHDIYVLNQLLDSSNILYLTMAAFLEEDIEMSAETKSYVGSLMNFFEENIIAGLLAQSNVAQSVFLQMLSGNKVFLQGGKYIAVPPQNDVVPDDIHEVENLGD